MNNQVLKPMNKLALFGLLLSGGVFLGSTPTAHALTVSVKQGTDTHTGVDGAALDISPVSGFFFSGFDSPDLANGLMVSHLSGAGFQLHPNKVDLQANISSSSGVAESVQVSLLDTFLSITGDTVFNPVLGGGFISGTTFSAYLYDSLNTEVPIWENLSLAAVTSKTLSLTPGDYSLLLVADMTISSFGTQDFNFEVSAVTASVPDAGATALLLGLGCLGFWSLRKARG